MPHSVHLPQVMGAFSPPSTGNFAQDNTGYLIPLVGILTIWIFGWLVLKAIRRLTLP